LFGKNLFGPVLPVIRINHVEEGIHHCNANNFGLQGCIFTKYINKVIMISDAIGIFLQVIGSVKKIGDLAEICKHRVCL
jgi:acyl-CoA reductase-like NAD-dependent aldehyde dehydrogenase